MPWYINEDGKSFQRYELVPDGIVLADGRRIPDDQLDEMRTFASHPDENPLLEQIEGVWYLRGRSMEQEDAK